MSVNGRHYLYYNNNSNYNVDKLTSFPSGRPLPRVAVRPIILATSVLNVRYSLSATPLRMVFISGIPEPAGIEGFDEDYAL